ITPTFANPLSRLAEQYLERALDLIEAYFTEVVKADATKKSSFKADVDDYIKGAKGAPKIKSGFGDDQGALNVCLDILNRKIIRHMFIHDEVAVPEKLTG